MSSGGSEIGYGCPSRGRQAHRLQQRLFVRLADVSFCAVNDITQKIELNKTEITQFFTRHNILLEY